MYYFIMLNNYPTGQQVWRSRLINKGDPDVPGSSPLSPQDLLCAVGQQHKYVEFTFEAIDLFM